MKRRQSIIFWSVLGCALLVAGRVQAAGVPLGGFIPFVGLGLTNQFKNANTDQTGTFFISDPSYTWGGTALGPGSPGSPAYFDLALLDTGAATHILTAQAASAAGFNLQARGFRGTNFQTIFGASGSIDLRIDNPLGVYAGPLAHSSTNGTTLTMDTNYLRGQTSFALLEAPASWTLPNILGLPIAAHHAIAIRNSEPQIFQHQGRTVRTPNVALIDLASGGNEGILRRTNLLMRPSAGFLSGPLYVYGLDNILTGNLHLNPMSPTVIDSGALYVAIDMKNGVKSFQEKEFLFDTGADLTVVSQLTAKRLGFDALIDQPQFILEVEGAGGVSGGVPGFYVDELNIETVGGSFTLQNVPVAVLDLPNPNDPGNVLDGILGMHVFTGRNIVIDANPAASPAGIGPRLYIGDPVSATHHWATSAASGNWATSGNWDAPGSPGIMWTTKVANVSGSHQTAVVSADSTVYQLTVSGTSTASMSVQVNTGATLTIYGDTLIETGGRVELAGGKLDTQFVNIEGGVLAGSGTVFAGTGPIHSPVRNLSGRVEPGNTVGLLTIDGDFSQLVGGTLAVDLAGTTAITQYDRLAVDRYAFLAGTLEINLLSFMPSIGAMFTIITAGKGVVGEFDSVTMPAGFQFEVAYNAHDVVLTVTGLGLAGDFNGDGMIDAADYIVWRKNGGTAQEYQDWRSNFGATASGGGSATAAVPEPSALLLLTLAICGLAAARFRSCRRG